MQATQSNMKPEAMKITVNDRPVTLFFLSEPNKKAGDYIKKMLINAYLIKIV